MGLRRWFKPRDVVDSSSDLRPSSALPTGHCAPRVRFRPAQTDVGENTVIKLLERPGGIPQIQLVRRTACEFPKISHTASERGRDTDRGTLQIRSHECRALLACPAHKLVG
jgi:hypothetical protein